MSLLSLGTCPFSRGASAQVGLGLSHLPLHPQVSAAETPAQRLPGVCRTRPRALVRSVHADLTSGVPLASSLFHPLCFPPKQPSSLPQPQGQSLTWLLRVCPAQPEPFTPRRTRGHAPREPPSPAPLQMPMGPCDGLTSVHAALRPTSPLIQSTPSTAGWESSFQPNK